MKFPRNSSQIQRTESRRLLRPSRLGVGVLAALGLPVAALAAPSPDPSPEPQQLEFSAAFVGASSSYDLSRFERGDSLMPGDYSVDVFVNEMLITRESITFRDVGGQVKPCFTRNLLAVLGVDTAKLEASGANLDGACLDLETLIPDATVQTDAGDLRLNLSIPQVSLLRNARGYVDPKLWQNGVNAFTLGYSFNASQFESEFGATSRQAYLGLEAGLNLGGWRIRNQSNLNWGKELGLQFQNVRTYAQHDVDRLQSQFTVGDTFTDGRLFDSVGFRGVSLATDDRMRPDSMNGFAPIVRGVAETNAHVVVRQAGYVIYDTMVAPGGFEIDDLGATGYGGDLEVTVEEADGSRRTFTVPFAAVPNLLRPGSWRYSATAGQIRNDFLTLDAPYFAEATYQRGISNLLTGYAGVQAAGSGLYRSALVGTALNTSIGAFAFDVTGAKTRFSNNGGDYNGYSARLTYSKSIPSTNTDFALAAYRYSSPGYFDLEHAVQLDDAVRGGHLGGGVVEGAGGTRSRFQMTLSQRLGARAGQLFVSGSRGDFWDGREVQTSYNAGWSNSFRNLSYNVSVNRARVADGRYDDTLYASFSVPLGSNTSRSASPPTLSMQGSHDSTGNGLTASVSGAAGQQGQFAYGVNGNFGDQNNDSIGANGQWRAPYANIGASFTQGTHSRQGSVSASGGLVVHSGGITLSNQLGDTIGLVEAKGAKGARISSGNARVDGRGYAVAPNLNPYRMNEVMLDPKDASLNVELDNTRLLVAPRSGAVVPLKFETTSGQAYLLRLTQGTDGGPVPFGAEVVNAAGGVVGYVGQSGQAVVRISDEAGGMLSAHWGTEGANCAIDWSPSTAKSKTGEMTQVDSVCRAGAKAQ